MFSNNSCERREALLSNDLILRHYDRLHQYDDLCFSNSLQSLLLFTYRSLAFNQKYLYIMSPTIDICRNFYTLTTFEKITSIKYYMKS